MVDRVHVGTKTAWYGSRRTSVRCPRCLAVAIDGNAVGPAPRSSFYVRPIPYHTIGIGAAVDGLNFVCLRSASARLRLEAASVQQNRGGDDRHGVPKSPALCKGHYHASCSFEGFAPNGTLRVRARSSLSLHRLPGTPTIG